LRLAKRGIPAREPGDLYVVLSVVLPKADTSQAKAAYEQFRDALNFDARAGAGI
jgi:curved DNA-binding protein